MKSNKLTIDDLAKKFKKEKKTFAEFEVEAKKQGFGDMQILMAGASYFAKNKS